MPQRNQPQCPLLPSRPGGAGSSWAALHRVLTSAKFSKTSGDCGPGREERRQHKPWALPWAGGGSTYPCSTPAHSGCQTGEPVPAVAGQMASSLHTHGARPQDSDTCKHSHLGTAQLASLGAGERAQGPSNGKEDVHTHTLMLLHSPAHTHSCSHWAHTHALTHPVTHADSHFHTLTFSTHADSQLCTRINALTQVCTHINTQE